jgi:hypothetical protein
MILYRKFVCWIFYFLGDLACKFGDNNAYQSLMTKSVEISDKYDLKIWKEVNKPLDES